MKSENPDQQPSLSLDDLGKGRSIVEQKQTPDNFDAIEDSNLEDDKMREEIADLRSDRAMRQTYADRILRYLEVYSGVVALFIIANGVECIPFSIDSNALLALVGSTAIAAIGLVGFIAKGLFGNKSNTIGKK